MLYTATDGTVWILEGGHQRPPPVPYGAASSADRHRSSRPIPDIVFGQGTDNQLWYNVLGDSFSQPWHPLGGKLTSKPGAVSLGGGAYAVFVRGTDGAVWERLYSGTVWHPWQACRRPCAGRNRAHPSRISPVPATSTSGSSAPTGRCT